MGEGLGRTAVNIVDLGSWQNSKKVFDKVFGGAPLRRVMHEGVTSFDFLSLDLSEINISGTISGITHLCSTTWIFNQS
jgi:hypothetical protein